MSDGTLASSRGRLFLGTARASRAGGAPLLGVHGGPGLTHESVASLTGLASERTGHLYDQLDCGRSQRVGDPDSWTPKGYADELHEVRAQLGQPGVLAGYSWGACLAVLEAARHPDDHGAGPHQPVSERCGLDPRRSALARERSRRRCATRSTGTRPQGPSTPRSTGPPSGSTADGIRAGSFPRPAEVSSSYAISTTRWRAASGAQRPVTPADGSPASTSRRCSERCASRSSSCVASSGCHLETTRAYAMAAGAELRVVTSRVRGSRLPRSGRLGGSAGR
jgi:pimeloyl-ACP methyl ester carboxylesterase